MDSAPQVPSPPPPSALAFVHGALQRTVLESGQARLAWESGQSARVDQAGRKVMGRSQFHRAPFLTMLSVPPIVFKVGVTQQAQAI